ncbi:MAG: 50S ribosomal protein L28 [Candidatus Riflebacteria bacterium]|nr:50S ribosomal protein L28 [Candidatus Riflebacteria bacterium]
MATSCHICNKGPVAGNAVSHSNRKTRRRWLPNLQSVRASIGGTTRTVKVCTKCIKAFKIQKVA